MRLKSFDNFLLLAMGVLAFMSLYMLYGAKFTSENANQFQVASIVEQLKTVKRKRDFYQGWIDVKPGDALSQNDEIYTHGQSSAKINFINGPQISLFENSLLRIKSINKNNTFSLDRGNLIATLSKNSPNLDIELNGKKYSFKSDSANIQIEHGEKENKFLLLDGKAKLADQEILPNQVVIQDIKNGNLKIKKIPFIPEAPVHNFKKYYLQSTDINFSWKSIEQGTTPTLSIARDASFKHVIFSETVLDNSKQMTFNEAGTYFWKLTGKDQISGPIKSFTLMEETPLIVDINQNILYQGPKLTDKAFVSWQKNNADKFLIKIHFPDNTQKEFSSSANHYEFIPEQTGEYLLSVKIDAPNRPQAIWSSPLPFTVVKAATLAITSLTPLFLEKVNYSEQHANHTLAWSGPSSLKYKIRLMREGEIQDFETEQTSISVNLNTAAEYTWEVQGEAPSGVTSNKLTGNIIIKKPLKLSQLPSEGAIIELEKPDQLVAFKWDQIPDSSLYQFELSDDPAFKTLVVSKEVFTNNASTALAQTGRYYWRVKVKKGNRVEFSNPISVEIKPAPPLSRPEIEPNIKIQLKYLEEKSSSFNLLDFFISPAMAIDPVAVAELDLPANSRAKNYTVEIYRDAELNELIATIKTEVPHVIWKNATPGIFYWRVSYTDFWGRETDFSKVSILSTEAAPAPTPPTPPEIELTTPKHREDILKTESDQEIFSWEALAGIKTYSLLIATDLEFENIIFNQKVSKNEINIDCKKFDNRAGDYYWKVVADENLSKRRLFHVSCVAPPELEPVQVAQPVATPEVSEEKRNLHFLKLGIFPHQVAYQNKASQYTAKIDGNALNSWYATYQRPLNLKYFQTLSPSLFVSRGKVFNTITFTDMELNLKAQRTGNVFNWGAILAFAKKTLYIESNLAITDEGISAPLLGAFIQKDFKQLSLNAEIKLGSLLDVHADLQYRMKNNYSIGGFVDSSSITKDENKHSFTRFGLLFNYTFDFLEPIK